MPLNELNTYDAYAQALLRLNPKMDPKDILDKLRLMPGFADEEQSVKTKRAIAGSVSRGYMLANQLPLLGLGNVKIASEDELKLRDAIYCELILATVSDACQTPMFVPAAPVLLEPAGFFTFIETTRRKASPAKLNIYAFRDPNDILGFKAVSHIPDSASGPYAKIEIAEIEHRNAREWLWLFANPMSAHANEDDRPQSLALIWCGGTAGPGGKLTAEACQ